jgi:phage terminase large subunit
LIVADSAEPRLIEELKHRGCNITKVEKPPGSINDGIAMMLDYEIVVDPNSHNIAKELNNYVYSDKKSGLVVDKFNHAIDSIRYNVYHNLSNPYKGKYHVH